MAGIDIDGLLDFIKDKAITALKGTIKELEDKLTDSYKERDRWLEEYMTVHDSFKKLLEKNEELEKINIANAKYYEKFWYKLEQYKNCISRIKRNIDSYCYGCRGYEPNKNCSYCNYKLILKKIKEVEDERI
jgi:hypothetical protein